MVITRSLSLLLVICIGFCMAEPEPDPQFIGFSWPGGGYFGNFGPAPLPYRYIRRRPIVVVNPFVPAAYPVYSPYLPYDY